MTNSYYNHGGYPITGAPGASAALRAELDLVTAGFALLPTLSGNANKALVINAGGSAVTVTTGTLALAGDFATTGAFNTTLVQGATTSLTLPVVSGTLATLAGTETLSNKTIAASTLSGTVSGGGNQINDVIIGTSTPLAGTFTTLTSTSALITTATTDATSITTGALQSAGGLGVTKALWVGGLANIAGAVTAAAGVSSTLTTDATSATTGSIVTAGGISTQKALWVGTTSRLVGAVTADAGISSTLTTDATSATTGSIVTAGGISTQKALWVGTTSRLVGAVTADAGVSSTLTTDATSATTGSIVTAGGISAQKAIWVGTTSRLVGAVTADAGISSTLTTDATSATTGSIVTAGGISTQKALWVGTTSRLVGAVTADAGISSTLTTDATSATTGSIVTAGGISTQKALWVGTTTTTNALTTTTGTISTTPSGSTDIANKLYVDTVAQGLDAKASCIAATTANITLSGTQTVDGIVLIATDRVLVKNQTASAENGLYLCAAGAWTRTTDADTWDELRSAFVFIEKGTVYADTGWVCTIDSGGTLGTTAVTWAQFSGAGAYTAGTGLTLTGTAFSLTAPVTVALGGTNATSAGITSFNNITGYTASGATGTTSTDLVFSASPTLTGTLTAATGTFSGLITASAGVSSTLTTDATSATTGSIITAGGISTQKALWVGTTSRLVGAVTADAGVSSTLTTDATSATTGSIVTAGGISMQKALWVGTTSRHVGATQFDAAITYGGITLSNAVTGTGNMVLSASPTLTGTLTAATGTFSGLITASAGVSSTLTTDATSAITGSIITAGGISMQKALWVGTTSRHVGAATFDSTIASGAITASYFTPTATGTNGLGMTSANRPGLYSTSQKLIDWFTTDNTYITYTGISSSGTGSALVHYNNAQDASGVTYNYYRHSGSDRWRVAYSDSAMDVYSYGAGTNVLSISYSTGAATFSSSVTATKFTATATGTNGLGLAAANTPALYASTTEFMRSTTALTTFALATTHTGATTLSAALTYGGITLSNAVTGTGNMVLSASPTLSGTLTAAAATFSSTLGVTGAATFSSTIASGAITSSGTITGAGYVNVTGSSASFFAKGADNTNPGLIIGNASGAGHWQIYETLSGSSQASLSIWDGVAGANRLSLAISTGAATFASSVTATLFTPTATGNNGLGLAAANTPALYASTTEFMRSTTALVTVALATTFSSTVKIGTASTIQTGGEVLSVLGTGTVQNASTSTVLFVTSNQAGDCLFLNFKSGSGGAGNDRGSVTYNSSTGLVVYNTTSDYRLKTLFGEYSGCGEVIDALQIHVGLMKGATMKRPMFVAHEVQKIVPEAVTGEKDAVDKDGNIIAQQLDATSLVPYLVAEVKMLRGRVRDLENKRRVA